MSDGGFNRPFNRLFGCPSCENNLSICSYPVQVSWRRMSKSVLPEKIRLWIPRSNKRVNAVTPDSEFCSVSSQLNTSVHELEFCCELEFRNRITGLNYNVKLNR